MNTLFDKIWDAHVVTSVADGPTQLYIDRHYCHEVTSPQAFQGLRDRGLPVFRPAQTICSPDHNIPTLNQDQPISDPVSRNQVETLKRNTEEFGVTYFGLGDPKNGVIHIIGPENGYTLPGMTIVCGDSHTSTHGAFGAVAFGIGTSEVEMVLASQCVLQSKPKTMRINIEGKRAKGVTAKDVVLYVISKVTTGGATGYFIEFAGQAIREMSMEERMTVCNMSIEMGARGGMIAADEKTIAYVKGCEFAPKGDDWNKAEAFYRTLHSDSDAVFDKELTFSAQDIEPMVTYGTNPGMGMGITEKIPTLDQIDPAGRLSFEKSLEYMGFKPGESLLGKPVDYVFLGSCTNGRIEDFRVFAGYVKGKQKAENVTCWLVPGSWSVDKQIREEGLDRILQEAGFELRQPGCSACLAMNEDKIPAGKYALSTSNRNFEGRQGPGARTILCGPLVAAAAAINGVITDPRDSLSNNKFQTLTSSFYPLPIENVDTDQIIPARFLKATDKEGFGDNLFYDWRYDAVGNKNPDFVLNQDKYKGSVLVAGKNFGSGSSREHAAWAVAGFGFQVVVSSFFADIFRNNALNNGVLPVVVSESFLQELFEANAVDPAASVTVNLIDQTITNNSSGKKESFTINAYKKNCLLHGYDDIDYLLSKREDIESFEQKSK